ncbi:ALF repeat-containing protein, partial [Streptomyces niveiscabiei]
ALTGAGPIEKEAIGKALDADTADALHQFLTTGQALARTQDERVRAAQLSAGPGPELRAAARVALDGPADLLHAFITTGQSQARRQDQLAA